MLMRKFNFRKNPLEVCEIAVVTSRKVVERGYSLTDWACKFKIEYNVIKKAILSNWNGYYWYEPKNGPKKLYPYGHGNGVMGTIFVLKRSNCTIENDSQICLTEQERKTGKISLERIQEIEDEINQNK